MTQDVLILADQRSKRQKALAELRAALEISTTNDTRAVAESIVFSGWPKESDPRYHHARRVELMCKMEDRIQLAIRLLEN